MRIFKVGLVSIFFITVMFVVSSSAAVTKIGIFDMDKIMSNSKIGKSAKSQLENKHKSLKSVLERKKNELEKMDEKLEKDRMVMGQQKYTEKKYEIQKKAIDFKELERKSTDEMRKLQQQLLVEINKEVVKIIEKIGKKENYTIIIEKTVAGAAYFDTNIDLTSQVVKELNSK